MWTAADIPDLDGCVAVVTGANAGLGLEVTRALAGRGATVVMAARDLRSAGFARDGILAEVPGATIDLRELDLASLASVRSCAAAIGEAYDRVDLLVNNAGVMGVPEQSTVDGFELQFGVNHLGHFVFTRRLLGLLSVAPAARVVGVTSFARFGGRLVDPANPHLRGRYDPWRAYGQAKLANLVFAAELQERLRAAGAPVGSLAAHPGLSHTGLQQRSVEETSGGASQRFWDAAARSFGAPPRLAAMSLLRAATDSSARGGELYGPRWGTFGPPTRRRVVRTSRRAGRILWMVSERETGERFDVAEIVAGR